VAGTGAGADQADGSGETVKPAPGALQWACKGFADGGQGTKGGTPAYIAAGRISTGSCAQVVQRSSPFKRFLL